MYTKCVYVTVVNTTDIKQTSQIANLWAENRKIKRIQANEQLFELNRETTTITSLLTFRIQFFGMRFYLISKVSLSLLVHISLACLLLQYYWNELLTFWNGNTCLSEDSGVCWISRFVIHGFSSGYWIRLYPAQCQRLSNFL